MCVWKKTLMKVIKVMTMTMMMIMTMMTMVQSLVQDVA